MAQSVRYLPCKQEDLTLVPRTRVKKYSCGGTCSSQHWGGGDRWILEAFWSTSLASLVSSRPVRDLVSPSSTHKVDSALETRPKVPFWPLHSCTYTCKHMHMHMHLRTHRYMPINRCPHTYLISIFLFCQERNCHLMRLSNSARGIQVVSGRAQTWH